MLSPFWTIRASYDFAQARSDATEAKSRAREALSAARVSSDRIDKLLLTCEALWTLVREKLDLTDAELIDMVNQIDLTDGVADGRKRRPPFMCPACERAITRRFGKCLYCEQPIEADPFV